MKALFLGTHSFQTAAAINAWLGSGNEIVGFWHSGRGRISHDCVSRYVAPQWSVEGLLRRHGLTPTPFEAFDNWADAEAAAIAANPDVIVSVLFARKVPPSMLQAFAKRIVNIHPARLPLYRGPHPTLGIILDDAGVEVCGVTLHEMTAAFDAGDIIAQTAVPFAPESQIRDLRIALARAVAAIVREIPPYVRGEIAPAPQREENALYRRVAKDELALGERHDLVQAERLCRLLPPVWPLRVAGAPEARIRAPLVRVGQRADLPPRQTGRWIEFDLADCRARARRQSKLWRRLQRYRFHLRLRYSRPQRD